MSQNVTDFWRTEWTFITMLASRRADREAMVRAVVDQGLTRAEAARRFHTSAKTVAKWVERFRAEGVAGLQDRSSRPLSLPSQTPRTTCDAVEILRRQRHTQAIARQLSLSGSTVSRILRQQGLSRLCAIEPAEPRPPISVKRPARSSISTSKSSPGSMPPATASPATAPPRSPSARSGRDGSSPMLLSMTTPASPSARSCPTKSRPVPSPS